MPIKFIHDKFLLTNRTAQKLYAKFAEPEPIFDFHNHLPPGEIAANRQFKNLYEIWLGGDHYKWRAMRSNGVKEDFCTGDAEPFEKFRAWAATVPHTLRNPLYHWTHLELSRYFGIDELLNEESAARIWKEANRQLATPAFSTHGILKKFRVTSLCTTDDPVDDLAAHEKIAASRMGTAVYPAFRPDNALLVNEPERWNAWVAKLAEAADTEIGNWDDFVEALAARHQYFHEHGCRLSDHGLNHCWAAPGTEKEVAAIFRRARRGKAASLVERGQMASWLMAFFGTLDAERGWVKQLHLGALRNPNSRMRERLGPDTGFDSIGGFLQISALANYLDLLDREKSLPRTVIYNSNPADNYAVATLLGSFNDGSIAGKVQMGAGWWFLDQKEGMEWQLNALSNNGLLSRFIGMVTDSRSFMSFPRHEYFRRVLCNLIGRDVEAGELPDDETLVGSMIRNICYANARDFLRLPSMTAASEGNAAKSSRKAMRS